MQDNCTVRREREAGQTLGHLLYEGCHHGNRQVAAVYRAIVKYSETSEWPKQVDQVQQPSLQHKTVRNIGTEWKQRTKHLKSCHIYVSSAVVFAIQDNREQLLFFFDDHFRLMSIVVLVPPGTQGIAHIVSLLRWCTLNITTTLKITIASQAKYADHYMSNGLYGGVATTTQQNMGKASTYECEEWCVCLLLGIWAEEHSQQFQQHKPILVQF